MSTFFDNRINTARTAQNTVPEYKFGEKSVAGKTTVQETQAPKPVEKSGSFTTSPISVVNPSGKVTGEVGEVLDIKQYNQKETKKYNEADELQKTKRNLRELCDKANINFPLLMVNLSALTGKTLSQFDKMNPTIQALLLNYVAKSIERVEKHAKPNVDKLQAVVTDVAIMYNAIIRDKNGNIYDLEDLSPEEIKSKRQEINIIMKKYKADRMLKCEKMSAEEKQIFEKEIEAQEADFRYTIYQTNLKKVSLKSALELMFITSAIDGGKAVKDFFDGLTPEQRVEVASTMHDFDSFKEYIKELKQRGENISDEQALQGFEDYHRIFGSYKTKESFDEYQLAAHNARINGELPEEVCRATSMGIGEAAYTNHVMSMEEKEASLQTWVQQNDGFLSDTEMAHVEQVSQQYVQEYLAQHPEEKDSFAVVTKSMREIAETTLGREFKPENSQNDVAAKDKKSSSVSSNSKESSGQNVSAEVGAISYSPSVSPVGTVSEGEVSPVDKPAQQSAAKQKEDTKTGSMAEVEIKNKLLSGEMTEGDAKKQLGGTDHALIKFYTKDPVLRALNKDKILCYIETEKDNEKLKELAKNAPQEVVSMIVNHMRGNKADFAQSLIQKHEVDFNTKQMLEEDIKHDAA